MKPLLIAFAHATTEGISVMGISKDETIFDATPFVSVQEFVNYATKTLAEKWNVRLVALTGGRKHV